MTRLAHPAAEALVSAQPAEQAAVVLDDAALLALDWGTSSLRAYVMNTQGVVLASRHEPWGLMQVPALTGQTGAAAFDTTFVRILDAWPDLPRHIPTIAAGMVGSAQGWQEVPYLPVPCELDTLAQRLVSLQTLDGRTVWLVPGLREPGLLPNVMRGEETQIVGALASLDGVEDSKEAGYEAGYKAGDEDGARITTLLGLPGSHAKWARLDGNRLHHFDTFMTGEAFTAFSKHTILARTAAAGAADDAAFTRGVETSLAPDSKGLLAAAFSCRTLGLSGELDAAQQMEYLSGLVIGAEIAGMRADLAHGKPGLGHVDGRFRVALVGDAALCRRYTLALRLAGVDGPIPVLADASERGLWQLACQAGLIAAAPSTAAPITPASAGSQPPETTRETLTKAATPAPAQAHTHAAVPSGAASLE